MIFFFKQRTAYELRISDWSSDVCASDLCAATPDTAVRQAGEPGAAQLAQIDPDSEVDDYGEEPDDNDPLEVPNRMFFAFNEALDFMIIRPVAVTYRYIVPTGVRNTVRNFLRKIGRHTSELQSLMRTSYAVFCLK